MMTMLIFSAFFPGYTVSKQTMQCERTKSKRRKKVGVYKTTMKRAQRVLWPSTLKCCFCTYSQLCFQGKKYQTHHVHSVFWNLKGFGVIEKDVI